MMNSSFALLMISIHCYEVTIHLVCDYFWHLNQQFENRKGWHDWNKIGAGGSWEDFAKLIMRSVLNDMKDFCYLHLKCSVMFYFTTFLLDLYIFCFCLSILHQYVWICKRPSSWSSPAVKLWMPKKTTWGEIP